MATSHYCNGKWRDGSVAACPRHNRLDRKQQSVYRSESDRDATSTTDSSSSDSSTDS